MAKKLAKESHTWNIWNGGILTSIATFVINKLCAIASFYSHYYFLRHSAERALTYSQFPYIYNGCPRENYSSHALDRKFWLNFKNVFSYTIIINFSRTISECCYYGGVRGFIWIYIFKFTFKWNITKQVLGWFTYMSSIYIHQNRCTADKILVTLRHREQISGLLPIYRHVSEKYHERLLTGYGWWETRLLQWVYIYCDQISCTVCVFTEVSYPFCPKTLLSFDSSSCSRIDIWKLNE